MDKQGENQLSLARELWNMFLTPSGSLRPLAETERSCY